MIVEEGDVLEELVKPEEVLEEEILVCVEVVAEWFLGMMSGKRVAKRINTTTSTTTIAIILRVAMRKFPYAPAITSFATIISLKLLKVDLAYLPKLKLL